MIRAVAFLLTMFLFASGAYAGVFFLPSTYSVPSSCPQGTSYSDGCSGAPAGLAPAPGLFTNGTGGTGTNYTTSGGTRPPWNVAGVDYRVGYPTNITLSDPASGGFPACASANQSTHLLTISGPCTINGYDFSLENGWEISILSCSGGTVLLENNNFVIGSNWGNVGGGEIVSEGDGSCNLDLEANTFDGNGCVYTGASELVKYADSGNFTAHYNQFLNSPQHGVSLEGSNTYMISSFNYYRDFGYASGAHGDPFLFNNGNSYATNSSTFDTLVNEPGQTGDVAAVGVCPANAMRGGGPSALEYFSPNNGGVLTNTTINNNTVISYSRSSYTSIGYLFDLGIGSTVTITSPVIENNYIDCSGCDQPNRPYNIGSGVSGLTLSGNIFLTNGASCNVTTGC